MLSSLLCSFYFLELIIRSSILGSSLLRGSGIDSSPGLLLGLSLGLLLGLLLGLILGLPTLVKTPIFVLLSLGYKLVLLLFIVLGITISKLFRTSKRESIIRIDSLFLGLPTSFYNSGYNYVLVINKLTELL